jgi:hypothetical protein
MNIYLDLEETVIDDWYTQVFLNNKIDIIKRTLDNISEMYNDTKMNLILFSAAVCDKNDIEEFENFIKPILEDKLRIRFSEYFIFSDENIIKLARENGISILKIDSIHDIFMFNIKEEVFNLLCNKTGGINVLFDDTIESKIVNYSKNIFPHTDFYRTDIFVKM